MALIAAVLSATSRFEGNTAYEQGGGYVEAAMRLPLISKDRSIRTIANAISKKGSFNLSYDLIVETSGKGVYEFTDRVLGYLREVDPATGLICCVVQHTTASLALLGGVDAALRADIVAFLDRLAPEDSAYAHRNTGPDDMPSHIKALITNASVVAPIEAGRLLLGPTQGLFLLEHRASPQKRRVVIAVSREG